MGVRRLGGCLDYRGARDQIRESSANGLVDNEDTGVLVPGIRVPHRALFFFASLQGSASGY